MSFKAIKEALDEQAEVNEAWRKNHDEKLDAISKREQGLKERIEELESRASSPGKTSGPREDREYTNLFHRWLRKSGDGYITAQLAQAHAQLEAKDVTVGTGSAGGFAVPVEIAREIERQEKKFSPVRDLVKVVQVGTPSFTAIVNIRGATSGWVAETGTRSATATPTLRQVAPTFGELYAYPQASEWSLDDIFFNVGQWLAEEVAQEFAILEGDAVIRGNGTTKPTGMLNTTPTTVDDFGSPLRAAAVYQYIASAASPDAILPDALVDLVYKVNSTYRSAASWAMNSATAGAIRKLKTTTNEYLWQPAMMDGQPERLMGYAVAIWEQMDDIGANKFPVAFGDFRRGYILADRVGLRITRDELTNPGFVRFYVRRREGGIVLDNNALKFLRTT